MAVHKVSLSFLAAGVIAGLLVLAGCADDGIVNQPGNSPSTLTAGGATVVYVVAGQPGATSVVQFPLANSSGNLAPSATLLPPSGIDFDCVATDGSGNLYVGADVIATGQGEVLVYPAGSNGTVTPTRTILGDIVSTTTTFSIPQSMHVSSTGKLAILSSTNAGYSVATLPATSSGAVTPTTLIVGSATTFSQPQSTTIDQNGVVYVSNYTASFTGAVLVFAAGATGNVAPVATINSTTVPVGIAADASGNVFTVLDSALNPPSAGALVEYGAGANGTATPTRTIYGSLTDIYFGYGVRLDSVGNLYMLEQTSSGSLNIVGFAGGANGNVSPGLNFTSSILNSANGLNSGEIAVR